MIDTENSDACVFSLRSYIIIGLSNMFEKKKVQKYKINKIEWLTSYVRT